MCKGSRVLLWCSLLVCLIGANPLCAQQNQLGRIIGSVRVSRADFPAHPVLISLEMRGSPIQSAYCDDQGRFGFYSLVANPYRILINDDAYEPVAEDVEVNPQSSPLN